MVDLDRRVVCAANRFGGTIVLGARHFDTLMHDQIDRVVLHNMQIHPSSWEQGFINTWGEFLTREEAWVVACHTGQIRQLVGNQPGLLLDKNIELFSENLY